MAKTWKNMSLEELNDVFTEECRSLGFAMVCDWPYEDQLDRANRVNELFLKKLDEAMGRNK